MTELDPFDASILNVLARVPDTMTDLREQLRERLRREGTREANEVADAILASAGENVKASKDARVTAAALKRAYAVR